MIADPDKFQAIILSRDATGVTQKLKTYDHEKEKYKICEVIRKLSNYFQLTYETNYSRMDQVKFVVAFSRPYPFKLLKDRLPQILLGPFFNNLSHIFTYCFKVTMQLSTIYSLQR